MILRPCSGCGRELVERGTTQRSVLERQITRVKHGTAIVIPESDQTRGHGSHTLAALRQHHLVELLLRTEKK